MKRFLIGSGVALVVVMNQPGLVRAHQVAPDPVVEMFVKAEGERLTVLVRLPSAVLEDAKLPRDTMGRIVPESSAQPLQLVGRDLASNLELQQDDRLLASPTIATEVAVTGESVDIVLTYFIRAGTGRISARLRTFRAGTGLARTIAHYDAPPSPSQTFIVGGDPERVVFDPGRLEVVRKFFVRGASLVLSSAEFLLFALCLAFSTRRNGALGAASAAFLGGEILAILMSAAGTFPATPAVLASAQIVTASAIVVAALQVITNPRSRWLAPLAVLFGLALGSSSGEVFVRERSLAGSHVAVALVAFLFVVMLGQMWVVALVSSAGGLLRRWGLPERLTALTLAVLAAHEAVHWIGDRVESLAQLGVSTPDRIFVTLTLGWATLILCAGIVEVLFLRGAGDPGASSMFEPADGAGL